MNENKLQTIYIELEFGVVARCEITVLEETFAPQDRVSQRAPHLFELDVIGQGIADRKWRKNLKF
jgi:hypothetical protein